MTTVTFLKKHKPLMNGLLFLTVAFLTCYTIYSGISISDLRNSLSDVSLFWILLCVAAAMLFICVESFILWILLKTKDEKRSIFKCIKYALVGYFYSGITPSATGGQPFQLYYMTKDGNSAAKSTVALLSMALFYKLIMVVMGVALFLFWSKGIMAYFGAYLWVFYLGLTLNVLVLFAILTFMLLPEKAKSIIHQSVRLLIRFKILKESSDRNKKIDSFTTRYKDSVNFLFQNKLKMGILALLTFIQRSSLLLIPVFIYLGLNLKNTSIFTILCIQAAIYVAVDMLPIPGAQGITELIYISAFGSIFTTQYLTASMIITRSASFYLILMIGMIVALLHGNLIQNLRKRSL